ncbi:MAG: nitrogenase molybdenum-iron protein subunit beta [Acidobacteriota bacterium]|nr:nitrogenase molybdenum-iron protein subunit beta [Acidobacteriota bacterium]
MLDATPSTHSAREALRINPAKTCQPIGAMYAALGIHGCMPHSHGSQGCCAYHRSHLTRHHKEPVMATTSSFTEGASVFGGLANMTQALNNIFTIYNPEIVAVHTTCLSEVIGDDIPMMIRKAYDEKIIPEGKVVIHANTPSFVGSHITGFAGMVTSMVKHLPSRAGEKHGKVNIIPGFVDPSDMRELKRLAREMGVPAVMFPDTSDVLDLPQTGKYVMYPHGGVTLADMKTVSHSLGTIALGGFTSTPAALELESQYGVPATLLELPIGLGTTDLFIDALHKVGGVPVADSVAWERGRLLDVMTDMHQYFYGKRVAVAGDPDHVISLVQMLLELEMRPVYVITGSSAPRFEARVQQLLEGRVPEAVVKQNADLFDMHQWIKEAPVDLIVGNSYCKHIGRAENIPTVRFGFPILDRMGHRLFPTVGYMGAMRLIEKMLDAMLDKKDRECPEEFFELVQ